MADDEGGGGVGAEHQTGGKEDPRCLGEKGKTISPGVDQEKKLCKAGKVQVASGGANRRKEKMSLR